jgi:DNA-binding transcriptional LysR family regulator
MLDPLTLDQLRILIAVAETGSFSAAARRLGRVQSAVSQSIQWLERGNAWGCAL